MKGLSLSAPERQAEAAAKVERSHMKDWLNAVIVNAPAVLLLAIIFSSAYLAANGRDIPSLFYFLGSALVVALIVRR